MKLTDTVWTRNVFKKKVDIVIILKLLRAGSENNPDAETDSVNM
jgi:hypothetical protein